MAQALSLRTINSSVRPAVQSTVMLVTTWASESVTAK